VTLGTEGSLYFDPVGNSYKCPTFFRDVIDSTGAGDAYFALTSALVYMETPQSLIPFLGNCCAGLKTMILGNKHAVSKTDLVRTVTGLLK
jgi:sugar/nucleoside kinase (ribokinase family)